MPSEKTSKIRKVRTCSVTKQQVHLEFRHFSELQNGNGIGDKRTDERTKGREEERKEGKKEG
jgi:hypothetical protein